MVLCLTHRCGAAADPMQVVPHLPLNVVPLLTGAAALGPEAAGWALAQVPAEVQGIHAVLAVARGAALPEAGRQSAEDCLAVAPAAPAKGEQQEVSVAACQCGVGGRDMTQLCCKGCPAQLPTASAQIEGGSA